MGNRGILHNDQRQIIRQFESYKSWVVCHTEFKGRTRTLMTPGSYTELFFLDEATAFAAGHRPCGECRRPWYRRFKEAWLAGNPQAGFALRPGIRLIDRYLHQDRLASGGTKRTHPATLRDLPGGTFVRPHDADDAYLLWCGRLYDWTPAGYDEMHPVEPCQVVEVLTPRSMVNAFSAGYKPVLHPSVMGPRGI